MGYSIWLGRFHYGCVARKMEGLLGISQPQLVIDLPYQFFFFCKNPRGHLVLNSAGEVWEMICSEGAEVSWYKLVWISEHIPWCIFIPCLALGIDRIPRTGYSFGSQVPQVCYAPCTFSSGVWANWRDQLEWTTPWMSGRILQGIYEPQLDRNLHGAL